MWHYNTTKIPLENLSNFFSNLQEEMECECYYIKLIFEKQTNKLQNRRLWDAMLTIHGSVYAYLANVVSH